ncbi:GerMN domain-containing protein [uncultured Ilumatobacter sp.]|uniref:GerMN domain-containing protein n=1 Tax=uncultured Ilumatobacter sp. TaxID=879968 RepID=UPI00374F23A7
MHRTRTSIICVVLSLTGCTIQIDETTRPVPDNERGQLGEQSTGDEATGSNRVFLLAPAAVDQEARLRSVRRDVPSDAESILNSLIDGPNSAEREAGLSSNLPDGLELDSARLRGRILTVSVNDVFGELTSDALRIAVAQLVATSSEIDGVNSLRLQISDENQSWPIGNGQNTDRPLTVYDYPGFVESSQPAYPAIPTANS